MTARNKKLKECLDALYKSYGSSFLESDPLSFVHLFRTKRDQEIVGLIASSLAYGKVAQIKKSITLVLERIQRRPYEFTINFDPKKDRGVFKGIKHRFNDEKDIACLFYFARQMIEERGSIGEFFYSSYSDGDETIRGALESFTARALNLSSGGIYKTKRLPKDAAVRFFFPSPKAGSACKRLNLYLRWMVRKKDGLDFGIWKKVDPAKLIIPLDTHLARISRNLGLSARKSADWKMAEEVTRALRSLDPMDPVKYDFALCRLGILDECPKKRDLKKCRECLIKELCII